MDTKFLSWFLSGGSVALPKRLLAYMQPLNLNFEELGELVYLFSLEGRIPHGDIYGKTAASDLVKKRFITYNVDTGAVSFDPLFDKMFNNTTAGEQAQAQGNPVKEALSSHSYRAPQHGNAHRIVCRVNHRHALPQLLQL